MILAVDFRRSLGTPEPIVHDHPTAPTGADGTGPLANIADDRTVRLRRRRRTIPESLGGRPRFRRGRVTRVVDNFALRELPFLAFVR